MATTRTPVPPVNLKDRIAALQQRNASGSHPPTDQHHHVPLMSSSRIPVLHTTGSLRDKIANFEKKGAVPVPRGSFGIGAPPVDDGSSKRKGELYGNRVPGLSKPSVESVPITGIPRKRTVSTSNLSSYNNSRSATPTLPELHDDAHTHRDEAGHTIGEFTRRLPSTLVSTGRRTVSDVLPQRELSHDLMQTPLQETEEEGVEGHEEGMSQIPQQAETGPEGSSSPPTIVVSSEYLPGESVASASETSVPESIATQFAPLTPPKSEPVGSLTSANGDSLADSSSQSLEQDAYPTLKPEFTNDDKSHGPQTEPSELSPTKVVIAVPTSPVSPVESQSSLDSAISTPELPPTETSSQEVPVNILADLEDLMPPALESATRPSAEADVDDTSASSDAIPTPKDSLFTNIEPETSPILAVVTQHLVEQADDLWADESFISLADADKSLALDARDAILVTDPPQIVASPPTTRAVLVPLPETPVAVKRTSASQFDVGDESFSVDADKSLALDTSEAIIVSEPPQLVSPTIRKGVLVPAPKPVRVDFPLPSPVVERPLISAAAATMLEAKSSRKSFHAIVHDKVREASPPHEPLPVSRPPDLRLTLSTTAPRTPSLQRLARSESAAEPDSPSFNDLAALMADAAMLEQQLSGIGSPNKKFVEAPSLDTAVVPEPELTPTTPTSFREDIDRPKPAQEIPESIEDVNYEEEEEGVVEVPVVKPPVPPTLALPSPGSSSLAYLAPTPPHSPTPTRIAQPLSLPQPLPQYSSLPQPYPEPIPEDDIPPTPPPKSPSPMPRYFSNLRSRKPSMPGAYPRTSYSSEDSSMLVATPPSPPSTSYASHEHDSLGSDTSSIRSSSNSWKSSKKGIKSGSGLGRATSVLDRLWHRGKKKGSTSVSSHDDDTHLSAGGNPQRSPSPTHLSPFALPPAQPRNVSAPLQRPTSWVSISTTGSGNDVFDDDIYDAFPSVPAVVPPVPFPESQSLGHRQYHSSAHLSADDYAHATSVSRSTTMPARSKAHAKQRSALV